MADLHNVLQPLTNGRTRTQSNKGTQFSTTVRPNHWGTDLRANVFNTPGDNVYAPCNMKLVRFGIGDGSATSPIPFHSGVFQYWDMGVWGGDRMYLYLGHLHKHDLQMRIGMTVAAGTDVADMGGSGVGGKDTFIDHLHVGVAQNTAHPSGKLLYGKGWIDPVKWFALRGVNFNRTPVAPSYNLAKPDTTNANPQTPEEDEMTPAQMKEIKDYIAFQNKEGPQWAKMGYDGSHAMAVHHEIRTGVQALNGKVQALTEVVTELASNTAPVTPEDVKDMLQRIEDRAVDTIASDYEITKKEG